MNAKEEKRYRRECGKIGSYYKWDLAKDWLRMSNDDFFNTYGFNWVPPSWMYKKARNYL